MYCTRLLRARANHKPTERLKTNWRSTWSLQTASGRHHGALYSSLLCTYRSPSVLKVAFWVFAAVCRAATQSPPPSPCEPFARQELCLASHNFDIVVVGAGNAGYSAAISAAESLGPGGGGRVLLIDKCPEEWAGGNSYFTAGAMRTVHDGLKDVLPRMHCRILCDS